MVAQGFEEPGGLQNRLLAVGMDGLARKGRLADANPEPPGWTGNGGCVAPAKRRRPVGRAEIRPLGRVKESSGVADAAAEEAVDGHAAPALAGIGAVRQACTRRLEAEKPA